MSFITSPQCPQPGLPGLRCILFCPSTLFRLRGGHNLSQSFLNAAIWRKRVVGLGYSSMVAVCSGNSRYVKLVVGCSSTGGLACLNWYLAYWIGASRGGCSGRTDGCSLGLADVPGSSLSSVLGSALLA